MEEIHPFEMLYHARWNVPQAAEALGLPPCEESWYEVKKRFSEWCVNTLQIASEEL